MSRLAGAIVHQVTAGFAPADAISDEARNIQRVLRSWGCQSEIYCWSEHIHPETRHECRRLSDLDPRHCDLLLYHFSIGSPATRTVLEQPYPKVMIYHNITPSSFYREYRPDISVQLDQGREELGRIRGAFSLALAVSDFNRRELKRLGYPRTGVLPILFDPQNLRVGLKERARARWLRGRSSTTLFFVGRLVPNKKAEDLLRMFSVYQRFYDPNSRFVWVGSEAGMGKYALQLLELADQLRLRNAHFVGYVDRSELTSWYLAGDIFVSASEHEGFCVPILESFHFGRPVVAYAAAAIPETLGEAGVLLDSKAPELFAAAVHRVVSDRELRSELVARGRRRAAEHFGLERVGSILREYVVAELSGAREGDPPAEN
jgi:glycosyltransferase involved in cell wall biosynthesis